jgi:hypothetical protein
MEKLFEYIMLFIGVYYLYSFSLMTNLLNNQTLFEDTEIYYEFVKPFISIILLSSFTICVSLSKIYTLLRESAYYEAMSIGVYFLVAVVSLILSSLLLAVANGLLVSSPSSNSSILKPKVEAMTCISLIPIILSIISISKGRYQIGELEHHHLL